MHTMPTQGAEGLTVLAVAPSRQELERRITSLSAGRLRRPVLVLGIDGAYVPTRPDSARKSQEGRRHTRAKRARWRGQWRDAKGFRFSLLDGERIVHVLSGHQVQNEVQLGEALKQIQEAGVLPEAQGRLCVVCDGAEWIWKHVQALVPHARQVLDYYHCAQSLCPVPPQGGQSPLWRLGAGRRVGRSDQDPALPGQSGRGLGGLAPDAGAVRRSRTSDGPWLGLSRRASGAYPRSPTPPRGLSVGEWGHRIVPQVHLSCTAQALRCVVV
jgi:hypothetical protein